MGVLRVGCGVGLRPPDERQEQVSAQLVRRLHLQERVQELAEADEVDVLQAYRIETVRVLSTTTEWNPADGARRVGVSPMLGIKGSRELEL